MAQNKHHQVRWKTPTPSLFYQETARAEDVQTLSKRLKASLLNTKTPSICLAFDAQHIQKLPTLDSPLILKIVDFACFNG